MIAATLNPFPRNLAGLSARTWMPVVMELVRSCLSLGFGDLADESKTLCSPGIFLFSPANISSGNLTANLPSSFDAGKKLKSWKAMMDSGRDPREGVFFCIRLIVVMVGAYGSINIYPETLRMSNRMLCKVAKFVGGGYKVSDKTQVRVFCWGDAFLFFRMYSVVVELCVRCSGLLW